ncbi:MAG: hypothetical protein H6706_05810 [Myxococcales bacterium]|nr:hypothetical protein [Myxococcales bacterium]
MSQLGTRPLAPDDRVARAALAAHGLPEAGWRVVERIGALDLEAACRAAAAAVHAGADLRGTPLGAWLHATRDLPILFWYAGFVDDLDVLAPAERVVAAHRQLAASGELYLLSGVLARPPGRR